MKIISWNCNGKFREKYKQILFCDADIYVIQECENPETVKDADYARFSNNHIWFGDNKNKGLGVFAKENVLLKNNNWDCFCLRNFISLNINASFNLLAVWTGHPYIEEYFVYHSINEKRYDDNMIIIGDFNSNSKWDYKHHKRDHSSVVKKLSEIGLSSAYHLMKNEGQGEESIPTFFQYRHKDKGYHIDYAFIKKERIKHFEIMTDNKWLEFSDHKPICLETTAFPPTRISFPMI